MKMSSSLNTSITSLLLLAEIACEQEKLSEISHPSVALPLIRSYTYEQYRNIYYLVASYAGTFEDYDCYFENAYRSAKSFLQYQIFDQYAASQSATERCALLHVASLNI
jgi:hypothetical protein